LAASGGVRLRAGDYTSIAVEGEGYWNYFGAGIPDEAGVLLAAGPEFRSPTSLLTIQGFGFGRWYGDTTAADGVGARARYQAQVGKGQRIYLLIDGRVFASEWGDALGGWQTSSVLVYEKSVSDTLALSGTLYGRREAYNYDALSNTEVGFYVGAATLLLGELRLSASAGLVRAVYDDPLLRFSLDPRQDWRLTGSLYLGPRNSVLGVWPSLSYLFIGTRSSISAYSSEKHRLRLNVRRSF
jgi:hypothetical protein